jgi:hypothetical protein
LRLRAEALASASAAAAAAVAPPAEESEEASGEVKAVKAAAVGLVTCGTGQQLEMGFLRTAPFAAAVEVERQERTGLAVLLLLLYGAASAPQPPGGMTDVSPGAVTAAAASAVLRAEAAGLQGRPGPQCVSTTGGVGERAVVARFDALVAAGLARSLGSCSYAILSEGRGFVERGQQDAPSGTLIAVCEAVVGGTLASAVGVKAWGGV